MQFALDCSMAMAWLFEDEKSKRSEALLHSFADGAIAWVPGLWFWEVGNVLLSGERRNRLTRQVSQAFMHSLTALPIRTDSKQPLHAQHDVYQLSCEWGLSMYDAVYLELALRKQLPLATLDKQLTQVAKKVGITLL